MREDTSPANAKTAEKVNKVDVCVIIMSVPSAKKDHNWRVQTSFASDGRIMATSGRLVRNRAVA